MGLPTFYTFEYNGSVVCKIKDYDGADYIVKTFSSAKKITKRNLEGHFKKLFLVETYTSKITQPSFMEKLKFFIFYGVSKLSLVEIITIFRKSIPIIKRII